MEQKNNQLLCHDAGRLLVWLVRRLSIPREKWNHTYCFMGQKKQIPTKKKLRQTFLAADMVRLRDFLGRNQPCVVVGLGNLTCECLLDGAPSTLKKKEGWSWNTRSRLFKMGIEKAWVSYSPDAALFDASLCVNISRTIGHAARQAGIDIKLNNELKSFDWSKYL